MYQSIPHIASSQLNRLLKMQGDQGSANNISFVTKLTTARHLGYSQKQIFCAKKMYVILIDQVSVN